MRRRAPSHRRAAGRWLRCACSAAYDKRATVMKIATWNVNGIRARQGELQDLIDREHPDVLCIQEIKASPDQLPVWLIDIEGYWGYWHGAKGYSGVALLVKKALCPDRLACAHPAFDFEHRIVTATCPASRWRRFTCRTAARTSTRKCVSWRRSIASPPRA